MKKDNSYLEKEITVPKEEQGQRLGVFLCEHAGSRSQAEKGIRQGLIQKKIGDSFQPVKASHKVKAGETYRLKLSLKKPEELKPSDLLVPVIFEDEDLFIINKPAGMVTHPAPGHRENTLVNVFMKKIKISEEMDPLRPGIVHRLDKDVSGLMILSKTLQTQKLLIEQFKSKKIKRLYRALALGRPVKKEDQIISFIGRHPRDRKKFYSFKEEKKDRKKAISDYKIKESFQNDIHHIECRLMTGRTHQIRLHLKSQNLPVLGDLLYFPPLRQKKALNRLKPPPPEDLKKNILSLKRLALYSACLSFTHPISKKNLNFKLPWPKELEPLLNSLSFEQNSSRR